MDIRTEEKGCREIAIIIGLLFIFALQHAAYGATKKHIKSADGVKTISGMSIIGNTEAPKSLVIVPWKSSRIGFETKLSPGLDDVVRPVDKDVFMREIRFYEIEQGK